MLELRVKPDLKRPKENILAAAIATSLFFSPVHIYANPQGGVVVGGSAEINQTTGHTQINQTTDKVAIEWQSFNVGIDERVEFIQPSSQSLALNKILSNDGSRILGQIDANGTVILSNPHGVLFGKDATLNVGGLVASGLAIDPTDFLNGDYAFSALEGSVGTVVNQGIINASVGGNVLLLGKSVANQGLISAELGYVALASGSEAVLTFSPQGMLGVKIDEATLKSELGGTAATTNMGTISASGGKILLSASASQNVFSDAVNHGQYKGATQAIVHDDGSFTLGAGNSVVNEGVVSATAEKANYDAGQIVIAGENITNSGTIVNNAQLNNAAGNINLVANNNITLEHSSVIESVTEAASGRIGVYADHLRAEQQASIKSSGYFTVDVYESIEIPELNTKHFLISSLGRVSQVGTITVSGNMHFNLIADADVNFQASSNDFNTFTLDSRYTSNIRLIDKDSLVLGNISAADSNLTINLPGDDSVLTQLPNTAIDLSDSTFEVKAENIHLGGNGSTTSAVYSSITLDFSKSINTNNSIGVYSDDIFSFTNIRSGDTLQLTGSPEINLAANFTEEGSLQIDSMQGKTANLKLVGNNLLQTGAIELTSNLHLYADDAAVNLPNASNDIESLSVQLSRVTNLNLFDKNSIALEELIINDSTVYISATDSIVLNEHTSISGSNYQLILSDHTITQESAEIDASTTSSNQQAMQNYRPLSFLNYANNLDYTLQSENFYTSYSIGNTQEVLEYQADEVVVKAF